MDIPWEGLRWRTMKNLPTYILILSRCVIVNFARHRVDQISIAIDALHWKLHVRSKSSYTTSKRHISWYTRPTVSWKLIENWRDRCLQLIIGDSNDRPIYITSKHDPGFYIRDFRFSMTNKAYVLVFRRTAIIKQLARSPATYVTSDNACVVWRSVIQRHMMWQRAYSEPSAGLALRKNQ